MFPGVVCMFHLLSYWTLVGVFQAIGGPITVALGGRGYHLPGWTWPLLPLGTLLQSLLLNSDVWLVHHCLLWWLLLNPCSLAGSGWCIWFVLHAFFVLLFGVSVSVSSLVSFSLPGLALLPVLLVMFVADWGCLVVAGVFSSDLISVFWFLLLLGLRHPILVVMLGLTWREFWNGRVDPLLTSAHTSSIWSPVSR